MLNNAIANQIAELNAIIRLAKKMMVEYPEDGSLLATKKQYQTLKKRVIAKLMLPRQKVKHARKIC